MRSRFGFASAVLTALAILTFGAASAEAGQPSTIVIDPTVTTGSTSDHEIVPILNPSFEDPTLEENNFTSTFCNPGDPICVQTTSPVIGWEIQGSAGTWNPTATAYPGSILEDADGANVAYANTDAVISQVLTAVLKSNRTYSLRVNLGVRADESFPGWKIQLWAGGTLLAQAENSDSIPLGGVMFSPGTGKVIGNDHPALGENLEIVLISKGRQTNFDNVRLTFVRDPIENLPFYVKLDAEAEATIVRNGVLELAARCTAEGTERSMTLFFTSTAPGWFSSEAGGPLDAGHETLAAFRNDSTPAYGYLGGGVSVAAPDGSYIGINRQTIGVGVNVFGRDCIAIGTAELIRD